MNSRFLRPSTALALVFGFGTATLARAEVTFDRRDGVEFGDGNDVDLEDGYDDRYDDDYDDRYDDGYDDGFGRDDRYDPRDDYDRATLADVREIGRSSRAAERLASARLRYELQRLTAAAGVLENAISRSDDFCRTRERARDVSRAYEGAVAQARYDRDSRINRELNGIGYLVENVEADFDIEAGFDRGCRGRRDDRSDRDNRRDRRDRGSRDNGPIRRDRRLD